MTADKTLSYNGSNSSNCKHAKTTVFFNKFIVFKTENNYS